MPRCWSAWRRSWFTAAALLLAAPFLVSAWVNSAAVIVLQSLAFVCLWTAIAIAVLKYRLYDIDRIISPDPGLCDRHRHAGYVVRATATPFQRRRAS